MKTIKLVGYINEISDIERSEGTLKLRDFLTQFVEEFSKHSSRYIRSNHEAPFAMREKQLPSIIAPVLSKITAGSYLMEVPVNREWSRIKKRRYKDSYGWTDYWCRFRGIDLFIETKHDYHCYDGNIQKWTDNHWRGANEQLNLIKNEAEEYSKSSGGSFLLAMHVVTIFETIGVKKKYNAKSIGKIDELIDIQKDYMEKLNPKPNWSALWILHRELAENSIYDYPLGNYKRQEYYPGVLFFVKSSQIIKS